MADLDAVMERLARLEAENARLRAVLDGGAAHTSEPAAAVSRRALLRGMSARMGAFAVGAFAAAGAAVGVGAAGVRAGGTGTSIEVGGSYTGNAATRLRNNTANGQDVIVATHDGQGDALVGNATSGSGVVAAARTGTGLSASSGTGLGLQVSCDDGEGARVNSGGLGLSVRSQDSGAILARAFGKGPGVRVDAVQGSAVVGFQGTFLPDRKVPRTSGVHGESTGGYGGTFKGGKAAVRLVPSTLSDHPETGVRGDLLVDSTGRLWFCQGGTNWVQLA